MLRSQTKMMKAASFLLGAIAGLLSISTANAGNTNNCTDAQVWPNGPIITTPCQSEIILQRGQNYTFYCKGKSELQFTQQEIAEDLVTPFLQQTTVLSSDPDYPFQTILHLYNVTEYAVGFYACYDDTVNVTNIFKNLIEEPNNTEHISFIYVYVNGTDRLFAPMREVIISRQSQILIECRPTTPDVKVSLISDMGVPKITKYSSKIGYIINGEDLIEDLMTIFHCKFKTSARNQTEQFFVRKHAKDPPQPVVSGGMKRFLDGETFTLNCNATYKVNFLFNLDWIYPSNVPKDKIRKETNIYDKVKDGKLYVNLIIDNATKEYSGNYICISSNSCGKKQSSFEKIYVEQPYIKISKVNLKEPILVETPLYKLHLIIKSYPPVDVYVLKDGYKIESKSSKYKLTRRTDIDDANAVLEIKNLNLNDTGKYTMVVYNKFNITNTTYTLGVKTAPNVIFQLADNKKCLKNSSVSFVCTATGYPLPKISWTFSSGMEEQHLNSTEIIENSMYKVTAYLSNVHCKSGNITCKATNYKENSVRRALMLHEIEGGFGILDRNKVWFSQNEDTALRCIASIYDYSNLTWLRNDDEMLEGMVVYNHTRDSNVATLKINQISLNHAGNYTCQGMTLNGSKVHQKMLITVTALQSPVIKIPLINVNEEFYLGQSKNLNCLGEGVPPPRVEWYKNDELLNSSNIKTIYVNHTIFNSTVEIKDIKKENEGIYECVVISGSQQQRKTYNLALKEDADYRVYLGSITVIILALIILVLYLTWKIKKEKKFRKELAAAGLLYFKEGAAGSLNPERGIDEQAELLPYDDKFEFPPEKLVIGKQLGAGAFGVVYRAEARGIINAEETNVVAVKQVVKTADNMYIKALASELKIMVHLGKHVNIVNLLGACTKNVGKRELSVIVEYCKFGNIHNYMQKHREVFIDQLTDNKEKFLGKVNRGFSSSTGSAGVQSEYFTSANTQDTDHTFLNTANSQRSARKNIPNAPVDANQVSEGYIQPEWRSNYESDYLYDDCRNPRPLTSRDLLAWAFQIARGMEYLASRKVLHGDLAARNVLLADDNIVKICDFGLARSIYKNDEYQKKENSPLPVKWLAIECMADRIFSTQSDVWSFGIVLWELFSLAKTPYPNVSPPNLLQWLSKGYRLEKPPYADDRLYEVMMKCWLQKPNARPSFTELQEVLGTFLEDNVRNHYVDLNSSYMMLNSQQQGAQDYLDMVCSPDYNKVVTPSPHYYVNMGKSFFPTTPVPLDEDGYLQMSPSKNQTIFSPRAQNETFDFDAKKFNSRASEASSCGSELTPMLTLNNLPARSGSESDHEGTTFPYSSAICPRIDEEADEVFEIKQNNAKNLQNNIAVSNPTYSFDVAIEKPKDIINSYVNMNNIPNGLVK